MNDNKWMMVILASVGDCCGWREENGGCLRETPETAETRQLLRNWRRCRRRWRSSQNKKEKMGKNIIITIIVMIIIIKVGAEGLKCNLTGVGERKFGVCDVGHRPTASSESKGELLPSAATVIISSFSSSWSSSSSSSSGCRVQPPLFQLFAKLWLVIN